MSRRNTCDDCGRPIPDGICTCVRDERDDADNREWWSE